MQKPPSSGFHFTVGTSITGFFGLFTWNKQLLYHEQLRATAHQLTEHRTQGLASRQKTEAAGHKASLPATHMLYCKCKPEGKSRFSLLME